MAGPSNPQAAHVIVGPAHVEPVFHGPRGHVMGRAGLGRDV